MKNNLLMMKLLFFYNFVSQFIKIMLNFEFKNLTKILFGKGEIAKIKNEIPQNSKILMLYGGSIKKNGIYEQVKEALNDFEVVEFGGIPANPEYETLLEALSIIKEQNITYLLAVGGGSVIDGTKFLSVAAKYDGENPWDILTIPVLMKREEAMPFGVILTIPATGSEMNSRFVISKRATHEKRSPGETEIYPQFSVLDPEVVRSLPKRQIVNGIADAYTHVLEQYMTVKSSATLQDRFAESILQTLQEIAPKLFHEEFDYDTAANFMWCCTMALNGLIQRGVLSDWSVHGIGHELTAHFGIDHARTLAIVTSSHYHYNIENKKEKLAQFAMRVWNVNEGTMEERALKGIELLEEFFHSLEIKTKLSDYIDDYEGVAEKIEKTFLERGWFGIEEHKNLTPQDTKNIVKMTY